MRSLVFTLALMMAGCMQGSALTESIDHSSFSSTGGTIFSDPAQVTTKELHFDSGVLLGRSVIIEGEIVTVGPHYTHLVMNDNSGRMLVILTQVDDAESLLKVQSPKNIKVLGVVESGKKGVPVIVAQALYPVFAATKS